MLELHNLTRTFGEHRAVDDVSFTVPPGQMVGFVGGNGAGKTTTMRMTMGLLQPDSGQVLWHGAPITADDRARFGYMPEERGLYPKQALVDQLAYLGQLKGLDKRAARAEATETLGRFGLGDRLKDKLEKLSLGNQQRVQIAAAVMASPTCLILDEPFSGLDPQAVDQMADLLRERCAQGIPVLFSSHQLDLVERLCDQLVVLAKGRVVAAGTREQLQDRGRVRHRLVTSTDCGWVRDIAGVTAVDVDGTTALLEFTQPGVERVVLTEGLARGEVYELGVVRPSLAEIYREVTA